jgi:hypothetical protein
MPPKGYLPINNKTYNLGEPLRGALRHSRRAIRSITFAGFARSVVPLLSLSLCAPPVRKYARINANNGFKWFFYRFCALCRDVACNVSTLKRFFTDYCT